VAVARNSESDPIRRWFPPSNVRDFAPPETANEALQPTHWLVGLRFALVVLLITVAVVAAIVINA
jgi:hypothetical protein